MATGDPVKKLGSWLFAVLYKVWQNVIEKYFIYKVPTVPIIYRAQN